MKNKHLVLLFLLALATGLVSRFFPWRGKSDWSGQLLHVQPGQIQRLHLRETDGQEWALEQSEGAWLLVENDQSRPALTALVQPLLDTLLRLRIHEILRAGPVDTFGTHAPHALELELYDHERLIERLRIGYETQWRGQAATWVQVGANDAVFLVPGYLRRLLATCQLPDPGRQLAWSPPDSCTAILISIPGLPDCSLRRTDSLWATEGPLLLPADSIRQWLDVIRRWNGSPHSSYFDETLEGARRLVRLDFQAPEGGQVLQIFQLKGQLSTAGGSGPRGQWFAASSVQPGQYFLLPDTAGLIAPLRRWQLIPNAHEQ